MNLVRLGNHPLAILVVATLLRHLADVDLGVEVRSEGHTVISGVAIDDIEVVDLVKVVLGGIGREDSRHTRIETATEDCRQTGLLEAILVSPLPRILELGLILRLVVGRIEVVATTLEAGIHDRQVLIRKGNIHHNIGLKGAEQLAQFGHAVGIDLGGLHAVATNHGSHSIALRLGSAGQHHIRKDGIGRNFLRHYRADTAGTDNQSSTHSFSSILIVYNLYPFSGHSLPHSAEAKACKISTKVGFYFGKTKINATFAPPKRIRPKIWCRRSRSSAGRAQHF